MKVGLDYSIDQVNLISVKVKALMVPKSGLVIDAQIGQPVVALPSSFAAVSLVSSIRH